MLKSEFSGACDGSTTSVLPEPSRTLQKIKIYLPFKTELVPIPKTTSYRGAFGALISSSPPPVVQDPSAVAPRVAHHDRIIIPKGFNCAICRPATDGSQVYLLARKKHQPDIPLGTYIFWVFLFNWKTRRRIQIRLPEVFYGKFLSFNPC